MRILMTETHRLTPKDGLGITVKYIGGEEYTVKREWGAELVRRSVAKEVHAPRRQDANG